MYASLAVTIAAMLVACGAESPLVRGSSDSHEFARRARAEYLTCDYVRERHWGEKTQRRYLVVLYVREHRVSRVFAVTHLLEVH